MKNKYKAIGVELQNGEKLFGKNIISNTDPTATFNMIDKAYLSQKLQKKLQNAKYSITSLSFFMVVDMDVKAAGLDSGNVWKMPNIAMDEVYNNLSVDYILNKTNLLRFS